MRRLRKGAAMKHDGREIKDGLRDLLALDEAPKKYLGARWIIREAITYINHLEGELRRQGFADYDTGEE